MRKFKLPKAFRRDWLKALESGRYKQGTDYLKMDNRYCCLGVAGAVLDIKRKELECHGMPSDLNEDLALLYPKCLLGEGPRAFAQVLAAKNDSGKTFTEIAKYIRVNTEGV